MEKAYTRTNWSEDTAPFIEADNLNKIESGIDTLDDRVVELSKQAESFATKDEIPEVEIATTENVGLVKPDGTTTYIDEDGTLHAVGGSGGGEGGTSDYNALSNKPSINGVTLQGEKTLADLGIEAYTDEKVSELQDETLGGFTPVIDATTGQITGYKTKAGADTVFPFSSGGKFATLNVIMSANATEARPFSYQITNDANEEYYGDFVTGGTSNNAQLTFKKSGKYKLIFRSAYRGLQSNISLKHGDTTITTDSGNTAMTEYEINAEVGDTLRVAITNKTNSYGFQAGEVTIYPA